MLRFELALVEQHRAFLTDHLALLLQGALHGLAKFAVNDEMHTLGVFRVKPPQLLEAPAGAGLEAPKPQTNGMFDGGIITDVEVKKGYVVKGAPIAPIHRVVIAKIERSSDNFAALLGEHQASVIGESAVDRFEKFLREILAAVIEPVDMILVQAKHRGEMAPSQFLAFNGSNRNTPLRHFTPFPLDFVPPIAAKASKVLVE